MTDYTKATGSTGTMMIRDTGSTIEYWLKAGSATYCHQLQWRCTVNGATSQFYTFDFVSGGAWQRLGSSPINDPNQTITFYMSDTGTSGLAGPTSLSATINHITAPAVPAIPTISQVTGTTVHADTASNGNGGAQIDYYQIGYGTSSAGYQAVVLTDIYGSANISGLTPGARTYFWARAHNSAGWSDWSGATSVFMHTYPDVPSVPTLYNVGANSMTADTNLGASDGGMAIDYIQIGWNTDKSTNPTGVSQADGNGTASVTGLNTGTLYAVRARARNGVGWSDWSGYALAQTANYPPPPTVPDITGRTSTSISLHSNAQGEDLVAPNDSLEIGIGTSSSSVSAAQATVSNNTTFSGLTPGVTYYFWSRMHNFVGYSSWNGPISSATFGYPNTTTTPVILEISGTYIDVDVNGQGDGGSPIDFYEVGWAGRDVGSPDNATRLDANGTGQVGGLAPGTQYWFWGRSHNAVGYSGWSARSTATTWNYPASPSAPTPSNVTQNSVRTSFVNNGDGGTTILEYQFAWGLNSAGLDNVISSPMNGINDLYGLQPGATYYFRARARNAVGWGNWSSMSSVRLIAGAYVDVAGVYKRAVPYVNVNGVWHLAKPYAKSAGVWRPTGP